MPALFKIQFIQKSRIGNQNGPLRNMLADTFHHHRPLEISGRFRFSHLRDARPSPDALKNQQKSQGNQKRPAVRQNFLPQTPE